MDAVAIYFRGASVSQTEEVAAKHGIPGQESMFLRTYGDWVAEISEEELHKIQKALGGNPTCAVLIESRYGACARVALELAAHLMKDLAPAVLDDDFGGLWSSDEVLDSLAASRDNTIFSLREAHG
jgi:hypothetical protein